MGSEAKVSERSAPFHGGLTAGNDEIMVELVQRLQQFLKHERISILELSSALNYNSPQKIYRLFNTENAWPSCQIITDIAHQYPHLSLNWLFTGAGNMIIQEDRNLDYKEKYFACLEEKSWIATKCLEEKEKYELLVMKVKAQGYPHDLIQE